MEDLKDEGMPATWPEVMVDLETLSLERNAVVLSIGAAAFDMRGVGPSIHLVLDPRAQSGRRIDAGTVLWWMSQPDAARAPFRVRDDHSHENPAAGEMLEPALALCKLADFFGGHCAKDAGVWGNGSDFDNAVLSDLFRWASKRSKGFAPQQPWGFRQNRCFRTLKGVMRAEYEIACRAVPRDGLHNAEADARWQAAVAARLLHNMHLAYEVCKEAGAFCADGNAPIDALDRAVAAFDNSV